MKLSNFTNAFGTITGILTAISAFLVSIGCSPGATDFAATCAVSWLPPAWAPILAGAFGGLTLILNQGCPHPAPVGPVNTELAGAREGNQGG